ncbi:MAG: hypothetical protein WC455_14520 [Dehalococcoidia bacterium]|jgi:hypothetical protein
MAIGKLNVTLKLSGLKSAKKALKRLKAVDKKYGTRCSRNFDWRLGTSKILKTYVRSHGENKLFIALIAKSDFEWQLIYREN